MTKDNWGVFADLQCLGVRFKETSTLLGMVKDRLRADCYTEERVGDFIAVISATQRLLDQHILTLDLAADALYRNEHAKKTGGKDNV